LYHEYDEDDVPDSAAALSYYFIFSLFPFLFFLVSMAAFVPMVRDSVTTLLDRVHPILPAQVMGIVDTHLRGLVTTPRPHLLTLGIVATLYSASRSVDGVRRALNNAYNVKETRPKWKTEALAFAMTIGGALLLLFGVTALVVGGEVGLW